MSKPHPADTSAIRAAEQQLATADRALTGAKDALRLAGALETRLVNDPLPRMSPRLTSYRNLLLAQNGMNETLADISIEHLLRKGAALKQREAQLREELRAVDASLEEHRAQTRRVLEPLEREVERCANATTAAVAALDAARAQREADLNATLQTRAQINDELTRPYRPEFRTEWNTPKPGDPAIAVMNFPDQS